MKKIVAILTQKGSLSRGLQKDTIVNLFKMDGEKVTEVENVRLEEPDESHFSLIMALKEVSLIYADTINNDLKRLLNKLGIKTKCREDILDDHFISRFIFE